MRVSRVTQLSDSRQRERTGAKYSSHLSANDVMTDGSCPLLSAHTHSSETFITLQ